ncbi:helix-turn-helix domain-containing protein [Lacticaseibacillus jixiensis]|uniref:helix-turn-helix domain-containing protein n=1 Tax=Lacticaseibacillus jixiensis TaxID=3231926 RepID=UPI0036F1CA4E
MTNRIKELRNRKGYTLDDLAKLTDIKRGTLNNYENEKTEPKLETWQKLAEALDVSVPYLQGISNAPSDNPTSGDLLRWDQELSESQAKEAMRIFEAIQPKAMSSLDAEDRGNLLGVLSEALAYSQSHPADALDLLILLANLNSSDDATEYPSPDVSESFKNRVLKALG